MVKVQELVARSVNETLNGLSFEVKNGEVLAVIGRSDCGKHLLGETLSSKRPRISGEIYLNNYRHHTHDHKVKIQTGYVANPVELEDFLTGFELLDLVGSLYHLSPEIRAKQIALIAGKLDIGSSLYSILERCTPATKQKIGLAAAFIHSPQFLILDEPTQWLDFQGQQAAEDLISEFMQNGCSTLLITDNLEMAERLADRFIILEKGQLLLEGTLAQLHNQTRSQDKGLAGVLTTLFGYA